MVPTDFLKKVPKVPILGLNGAQNMFLGILAKFMYRTIVVINLRHRRWTEVTVFTPVFVCLFVCEQYSGKNSWTDFDETWWGD